MKFSIRDFFSKCDQICRKLRIWSHLLKKSLTENFIFLCSGWYTKGVKFFKTLNLITNIVICEAYNRQFLNPCVPLFLCSPVFSAPFLYPLKTSENLTHRNETLAIAFIVNFEHNSHLVLVFSLLNLNM